jgi:hypothetical protein
MSASQDKSQRVIATFSNVLSRASNEPPQAG